MINTSTAYRKALEGNREFRIRDKITFKDGTSLQLSMSDFMEYNISESTSESGKFEIGAAVIKEYSATLKNDDGKFDSYNFEGADIKAIVGLRLADGNWEDLNKGLYRIVSAKASELTIKITAYDSMLFFDTPYSESNLTYPATITQIIQNACTDCQMTFDASTVELGSYKVKERPDDDTLTYRDVISYCAQIMGCYAKINHLDSLSFGWYQFDLFGEDLDGGIFDSDTPYSSGDDADGGAFSPWNTGYVYDAGTFYNMKNIHHLHRLTEQSINTDDISITGIKVCSKTENEEDVESTMYGEEGYVLEISDNPLIQSDGTEAVAAYVGGKIAGNTFRPLSISCQSDPSMEAGDVAYVTDWKQRTYRTAVTNTIFILGGVQKVECTAETPTEKKYTKYGAATKLLQKAENNTKRQLSAYDIAVQNLTSLITQSFGVFKTEEVLEDGSTVYYLHNKPNLEDSGTIWKMTADAFAVSTDGGKTWKAGMDSAGNAVVNVLSAIGLNAEWINTGQIMVKDSDGNITFFADVDTGYVIIDAESIAIGGKGVNEIAVEANAAQLKVMSDKIESKVGSGEVESIIEQKVNSIRLKADKISWNSTYSSMTEDGKLTCQSAVINGDIKTVNTDGTYVRLRDGGLNIGINGSKKGSVSCSDSGHMTISADNYIDLTSKYIRVTDKKESGIPAEHVGFTGDISISSEKTLSFVNGICVTNTGS